MGREHGNFALVHTALEMEKTLAEQLKGRTTPSWHPLDIIVDDCMVGIEVKTMQISTHGQIFMNSRAKELKYAYAAQEKLMMYTVAVDVRSGVPQYYLREGIGSFRLENMRRVVSPRAIRCHLLRQFAPRLIESPVSPAII